jgi:DICT domain-containing protein
MSLRRVIELVDQLEKQLVLFNVPSGDTTAGRLSTQFATHNVSVTAHRTPSGRPADLAVLSNQEDVLARFAVDRLRSFLDHTPGTSDTLGVADAEYEQFLTHLKETTFQSQDFQDMLYSSREIEDRASRVGTGTIHAGFQRCSLMADQRAVYTDLARTGLSVHTYGIPDISPPDLGDTTIHTPDSEEIAEMWFVVFDGGGDDCQKTALVAEELQDRQFKGVWTYDPEIVDRITEYLETTYLANEPQTRLDS